MQVAKSGVINKKTAARKISKISPKEFNFNQLIVDNFTFIKLHLVFKKI